MVYLVSKQKTFQTTVSGGFLGHVGLLDILSCPVVLAITHVVNSLTQPFIHSFFRH